MVLLKGFWKKPRLTGAESLLPGRREERNGNQMEAVLDNTGTAITRKICYSWRVYAVSGMPL